MTPVNPAYIGCEKLLTPINPRYTGCEKLLTPVNPAYIGCEKLLTPVNPAYIDCGKLLTPVNPAYAVPGGVHTQTRRRPPGISSREAVIIRARQLPYAVDDFLVLAQGLLTDVEAQNEACAEADDKAKA